MKYGKHGFESVVDEQEMFNTLPEISKGYVIAYGLRQSLNDSMASAETAAEAQAAFESRLEKLQAGKMGIREVGPRDPFESECKSIAEDRVIAALKKKGMKRPEADVFKGLIASVRSKYAEEIETEARERLARAKAIDVDVDDLLEGLQAS